MIFQPKNRIFSFAKFAYLCTKREEKLINIKYLIMKTIRIFALTVSLLSIWLSAAHAQDTTDYYTMPKEFINQENTAEEPANDACSRLRIGAELGAGISGSKYHSAYSTYAAPHLNYRATDRLQLNAGVRLSVGHINNAYLWHSAEGLQKANGRFTSAMYYTQGLYQVNERLTVSGSVFYEKNQMPVPEMNPAAFDRSGYSFGATYRLSRHTTIGVEIQQTQGQSPYYRNSFGRNSYFAPWSGM